MARRIIEAKDGIKNNDPDSFETIQCPKQLYAVFETEKEKLPTRKSGDLHRKIISEWLPSSDYLLADAPEIQVIHWHKKPNDRKRYIELWIPIEEKL